MNPRGYLALVLHAHLPYIRHPEHPEFLEEDWLFEAITESYLPLLSVLDHLQSEGVDFRITVGLTPPLIAMLDDELLRSRYLEHIDRLIDLAGREARRLAFHPRFGPTARFYEARFRALRENYRARLGCDLAGAFRKLQEAGRVELIASAATHAYLPHLRPAPGSIRAQVRVGIESYRRAFGREPQGFWLPECAYYPGLDRLLADEGIRYFFVETHGIERASRRSPYGIYAPVACPGGPAAFGRDPETSRLVWSSETGYPGDPEYRDFYRDAGFDAPADVIREALGPGGIRIPTGLKYHRVTGRTAQKEPYARERAMARVEGHAAHFVSLLSDRMQSLSAAMDRRPLVVAPYDAELFGHWWFEGPEWLGRVLQRLAASGGQIISATPSEYLAEYPEAPLAEPAESSWGRNGYHEVWLDPANQDIAPRLLAAARRMEALVGAGSEPRRRGAGRPKPGKESRGGTKRRRALDQAARELLLAEASDWSFIRRAGTTVEYARRRQQEHLERFETIARWLEAGKGSRKDPEFDGWLEDVESRDAIFPWVRAEAFAAAGSAAGAPAGAAGGGAGASGGRSGPARSPRVAFITAEAFPYAKAGGLGDVAGALPAALAAIGAEVLVLLPAHRQIDRNRYRARILRRKLPVWTGGVEGSFQLLEAEPPAPGVRVLLIDHPDYFDRDGIYVDSKTGKEYPDAAERYIIFSRAAIESLRALGEPIDILHCHDHQAAMALPIQRLEYRWDPVFQETAGIFTIHNLGYQGIHPPEILDFAGVDREWFRPGSPFEYYGRVNLMKIGIEFADKVNAVSETYAREICAAPELGAGLEQVLRSRGPDLVGILNGIDVEEWNPEKDPHLPAPYSAADLAGKREARRALARALKLDPGRLDRPLAGMVTRLVDQKGLDLLESCLDGILDLGIDLAVLGTGLPKYHLLLERAAQLHPGRIGAALKFDNALAHLIEGGSDIFLMPSLYEPCGLNQMYSLRYGTPPVARRTGGLADTVVDDDENPGRGNGFLFDPYTPEALLGALRRAADAFMSKPRWRGIIERGMRADHSWKASAARYLDLYRAALARRARLARSAPAG